MLRGKKKKIYFGSIKFLYFPKQLLFNNFFFTERVKKSSFFFLSDGNFTIHRWW